MKKLLLLSLVLGVSLMGFSQTRVKNVSPKVNLNLSVKKPVKNSINDPVNVPEKALNQYAKSGLSVNETQIGATIYDLQSNSSMQNRIYYHSDGTIGGTWTMGTGDYTDRGTGYNYFDGMSWGSIPSTRIENERVGWPSYVPWGPEGELAVTHLGSNAGLKIAKRTPKGTGTWMFDTLTGPPSTPQLLWPRAVASGDNNQYLHVVGLTAPVANSGTLFNGQDGSLLYSRSSDGGATWDIQNVQFPNTDTNYYYGLSGDCYAFSNSHGNTLAFVYGNDFEDLFMMKTTNNGQTWTKTVIFQAPYPKFKETTTLVLDTPTVCDGDVAVAIDNNGKAHVFFGLMRVLNDDLTDGNTSFFPYTDGLAYWTEDMPTFTHLDIDTLYNNGQLVGWIQDLNGNDTTYEFVDDDTNPPLYYVALTSMPTATVDEDNNIYVFFTSLMEHKDNGVQNYRHLWGRRSTDGGATWSDYYDVTGGLTHNFHECVFPSLSYTTSDNFLHLVYQVDEEPGLSVRGDEDAAGDNYINYLKVSKILNSVEEVNLTINFVTQNIPNPFTTETSISVNLNRASDLSLEISNLMGQKVYEIPAKNYSAGLTTFKIDGSNFQPGIYMYTVTSGNQKVTKKMIVQ